MSYWVEILCDAHGRRCASDRNNNPGEAARDLAPLLRTLRKSARNKGWSFDAAGKATCPACRGDIYEKRKQP